MKTFPLCTFDSGSATEQFLIYDPDLDLVTTTYLSPLDGYLLKSGGVVEAPIQYTPTGSIESETELINVQQTYDQILISIIENLPFPTQLRGGYDQEITGQIHLASTGSFDATVIPKEYVNQSTATFLPLAGGTITAPLVLHSALASSYEEYLIDSGSDRICIPKIYVDTLIADAGTSIVAKMFSELVQLSGGSVYGELSLSSASCFEPKDLNEIVSKAWIESYLGCVFSKIQAKGEILVEQEITNPTADSLKGSLAILKVDFAITRQSIGGGTCSGRDYPFTLIVNYESEYGLESYSHNFYYNPWGSVVPPHTQVRQGWAHFEIDLMGLEPTPKTINKVSLRASGFEWKTEIDQVTLDICTDADSNAGEVIVVQTLDDPIAKDLTCDSELTLAFDINVIRQESDDRPMTVRVDYQSDEGPSSWIKHFFHGESESFGDNEIVKLDDWEHFEFNLSNMCPCASALDQISVSGAGYGYEAQIDNVVLELESQVEIKGANSPKMVMDKTPPQSVEINGKPTVMGVDVKIDSEDPSSLAVPLSVQVDYTDEDGVDRTHVTNISSQPFDTEYLNAKANATKDVDCSGGLYYSNPDCPGYKTTVGSSLNGGSSAGAFYWSPNRWMPNYEFGSYDDLEIFDINKELGTIGINQISAGVAGLSSLSSFNSQLYPTSGFGSGFGAGSSFGSTPSWGGSSGFGSTSNSYSSFGAGSLGSGGTGTFMGQPISDQYTGKEICYYTDRGTAVWATKGSCPKPAPPPQPDPPPLLPPPPPPVEPPAPPPPTVSEKVVPPGEWTTVDEDLAELPNPPAKINKVTVKSEGDNTQVQFDNVEVNVCEGEDCNNVMDCPKPLPQNEEPPVIEPDPEPEPDPPAATTVFGQCVDYITGSGEQSVGTTTLTGGPPIYTEMAVEEGTLHFTDTANITGVWDDTAGKMTFTGTATTQEFEDAMSSVTFSHPGPAASGVTIQRYVNWGSETLEQATYACDIEVTDPVPVPDPAEILLLIDDSGSMYDDFGSTGIKRLEVAKTAVQGFLDATPDTYTIGIEVFPGQSLSVETGTIPELKTFVDAVTYHGTEHILNTLTTAWTWLEAQASTKTMIMLVAGIKSTTGTDAVTYANTIKSAGATIYVISMNTAAELDDSVDTTPSNHYSDHSYTTPRQVYTGLASPGKFYVAEGTDLDQLYLTILEETKVYA